MLHLLMSHFCHEEHDPKALASLGAACQVLTGPDGRSMPDLLARARDAGCNLAQIGGLALVCDRRDIAQALREHFNIHPQDYLTTAGEAGIDAAEGYPLLAWLCFMRDEDQILQALEWGADPNATWKVAGLPGTHKPGKCTISFVSEAIRNNLPDIVEALLGKATPPSVREVDRRMIALWRAPLRNHNGHRDIELRATIKKFAPGGKYAQPRSFWEVTFEGGNLGQAMAASMLTGCNQSQRNMGVDMFEDWIKTSIPQDGQFQRALLLEHFQKPSADRFEGFVVPKWCLPCLTPSQAHEVLQAAYPCMLRYILDEKAQNRFSPPIKKMEEAYERCMSDLAPLVELACQHDPEPLGGVFKVLGRVSFTQFRSITSPFLMQMVSSWPGDRERARNHLQEFVGIIVERENHLAQLKSNNQKTRDDAQRLFNDTTQQLDKIHTRCALDAATPDRPARASPRL